MVGLRGLALARLSNQVQPCAVHSRRCFVTKLEQQQVDYAASPPKLVIAVDGPAASGKGTLSRLLAAHFRCAHLDTGLLYRALAWQALQSNTQLGDEAALARLAAGLQLSGLAAQEQQLRREEVGQAASKVSVFPAVRAALLQAQRDFANIPPAGFRGAVLDGRDVGTVVCPGALAKLFVTADVTVRAERRYKELLERHQQQQQEKESSAASMLATAQQQHKEWDSQEGRVAAGAVSYEEVLKEMEARDARDASRAAAPCKPAADALLLDTTSLNIQEAFQAAVSFVESRIAATKT